MGMIVLILLLIAAVTGALWFVLKIAAAVALGLFVGVVLIGAFAMWRVRRALERASRDGWNAPPFGQSRTRWRRVGRSRVEVLDRTEQ